MDDLGPAQKMALAAFMGKKAGGGPDSDGGVSAGTLSKLSQLASGARKRVDERYFSGEFKGVAIHQNRKMHLIAHHEMHDHLIDSAHSHVMAGVREHAKIQKRAKEQFAADTYAEQVREARNRVIDQDNELLLRGLFNVAERKNTYHDALFLERSGRVKNAMAISHQNAKDWEIKHINRENQEILGRLIRTTSAYDAKKWERDFVKHKQHVKMSSKVKPTKSRRARHSKGFDASTSKEDRDSGALLPSYEHTRDPACLTYTKSKAFRKNKARHDRMLKQLERSRNKKAMLRRRATSAGSYRPSGGLRTALGGGGGGMGGRGGRSYAMSP